MSRTTSQHSGGKCHAPTFMSYCIILIVDHVVESLTSWLTIMDLIKVVSDSGLAVIPVVPDY